jgi:glycosyltransferase involved in cell wall biosynthesis
MSAPLVSIVIPCYNQSKFLRRTLASVLQNKYRPVEILVIDDGSKDDSAEIVRAMQAKFPEIKLYQKENGGVSSARNFGVQKAEAEYIAFLDADDLFYADTLTKRMEILIEEDEPELLGVYCGALVVDDKGNPLMNRPLFKPGLPHDRLYYSMTPQCPFIPSGVIVKKSKMLACGLFDETICPAEDFDLWQKMLRQGGYFRLARSCYVGWVQHEHSASHNQIVRHHNQMKRVADRLFAPDPTTPVEEFKESYGKTVFYHNVSENAFYSAMMAVISGAMEAAIEISTKDISSFYMRKIGALYIESNVRICACRTLCKSETLWVVEIWPQVRDRVREYFDFLEKFYKTKLPALKIALQLLEEPPPDLESLAQGKSQLSPLRRRLKLM